MADNLGRVSRFQTLQSAAPNPEPFRPIREWRKSKTHATPRRRQRSDADVIALRLTALAIGGAALIAVLIAVVGG